MSFLLSKIESMHWAITPQALEAIWRISSRQWTSAEYEIFHRATKDQLLAITSDIGERVKDSDHAFVKGSTGILLIDGPIIPRADSFSARSGIVSIESLAESFKAFEQDEGIKRILLLVDSPGGDIVGLSDFAKLVANSEKQTVSFAYGSATSAAYWIASAADEFYTSDTAVVGSIGVVAVLRKNPDENTIEIVSKQSPDKRPDMNTEKGRANQQQTVNELSDVFVSAVAKHMNTTTEKVESDFGKGGLLVAARALSLGMIDKVSTLDKLMSSFDEPRTADVTDRGG